MDDKLIYLAIVILGAFVAIWIFIVVPAERRHHERKLEAVRSRLEKRRAANDAHNEDTRDDAESAAANEQRAERARRR